MQEEEEEVFLQPPTMKEKKKKEEKRIPLNSKQTDRKEILIELANPFGKSV